MREEQKLRNTPTNYICTQHTHTHLLDIFWKIKFQFFRILFFRPDPPGFRKHNLPTDNFNTDYFFREIQISSFNSVARLNAN
jgi:hypothetical protein